MPRKKQKHQQHFPVGLSKLKIRGKQRFRYRTTKPSDFLFPEGTTELDAIEAATIYNRKYRNSSINLLLNTEHKYNSFSDCLIKIKERIYQEEVVANKLSVDVFNTLIHDIERMNKSHGDVQTDNINLNLVNEYLTTHYSKKSANVYNAKLANLVKVFDYLMDEGVISNNYAKQKKKKPKPIKVKKRLTKSALKTILKHAEPFLQIAIRLSFQTTHAVNEISKIKYSDCEWLNKPMRIDVHLVFGYLYIHREKSKYADASRVKIPITDQIKMIIDDSKSSGIDSPYIVHRLRLRKTTKLAKGLNHQTQVRKADISEGFSRLRDNLKLFDELEKEQRPTFHEIRSLAIHLYDQLGIDPQKRAAHSDSKTTQIYKKGHTKWVLVEPAQLDI